MKTIVTIDFDIIMAPSIQLYNGLVPGYTWDDIFNMNLPYFELLTEDGYHFKRLTKYIIGLTRELNANQFSFIHSHENVIKVVKNDYDLRIINIDHHHDLGYAQPGTGEEQKYTCANWVKSLFEDNKCISYTWIHNENSEFPIEDQRKFLTKDYSLRHFNLDSIPLPDEVILCLSNPWVPPNLQNLFYTWIDILNEIYDTHFDFID